MKSQFFSIPGLIVDVTQIVGVRYNTEYPCVLFRNGVEYDVTNTDAKCIQEYIEEYEQHQFDVSKSLAKMVMPSFISDSRDAEA